MIGRVCRTARLIALLTILLVGLPARTVVAQSCGPGEPCTFMNYVSCALWVISQCPNGADAWFEEIDPGCCICTYICH